MTVNYDLLSNSSLIASTVELIQKKEIRFLSSHSVITRKACERWADTIEIIFNASQAR